VKSGVTEAFAFLQVSHSGVSTARQCSTFAIAMILADVEERERFGLRVTMKK
jgi:hypothetical protein